MRIKEKFNQLKKENKKAFIAYVPFGFPSVEYTKDIILALQSGGADIIELGIPFSDPLADGPIIQRATSMALKAGADVSKLFSFLTQMKGKVKVPLVIMTYYNPFLSFGMDKFFRKMKDSDVSGIIIVDLPVEESKDYIKKSRQFDLETVFFITPTTSNLRAKKIMKSSLGFIYYISITGITGPTNLAYGPISTHIKKIKKINNLPVCVGFGIHDKKQVEKISKISDGVIVGSSIVKFIDRHYHDKNFLAELKRYIRSLQNR